MLCLRLLKRENLRHYTTKCKWKLEVIFTSSTSTSFLELGVVRYWTGGGTGPYRSKTVRSTSLCNSRLVTVLTSRLHGCNNVQIYQKDLNDKFIWQNNSWAYKHDSRWCKHCSWDWSASFEYCESMSPISARVQDIYMKSISRTQLL